MVATWCGNGGSVLTKDLTDITVWAVYQAVDSKSFDDFIGLHPNPSPKCPVGKNIYSLLGKPYNEIKESMQKTMETITLQHLLEDYKDMNVS